MAKKVGLIEGTAACMFAGGRKVRSFMNQKAEEQKAREREIKEQKRAERAMAGQRMVRFLVVVWWISAGLTALHWVLTSLQ